MVKCSKCGAENPKNALHCQECGEKIKKPKKGRNKLVYIGLGVLGLIILFVVILSLTSTPGVTDFDKKLIEDVNDGVSASSLIPYIKEYADIERNGVKKTYGYRASMEQSSANITNESADLDEVEADYNRELEEIQKNEDLRISFVNREIDEETFKQNLMEIYKEYND